MAKSAKKVAASALTLAMIVEATQSAQGFLFATKEAAASFINDGTAEMNEGVANPANANEFAVRATAKGINAMTNTNQTPATPAAAKPTFSRIQVAAADLPVVKRGGGGVSLYPFDDLAAPTTDASGRPLLDGFFVPATAEKPKPWESLQSAVSAATRRYATKTGEASYKKADGSEGKRATYNYTRKFKLSKHTVNGTEGAFVSRSQ